MNIKFTIKYLEKKLVFLMLLLSLFSGALIDFNPIFGPLSAISLGLGLLIGLLYVISRLKNFYFDRTTIISVLFLVWSLFSYTWSSAGLYNLFDRYRYMLVGITLFWLSRDYIDNIYMIHIMNFLLGVQLINAGLTVYQNEILGLHPDFCNGIFGTYDYFNSSQGIISLVISCLSVMHYIYNTWDRKKCIISIILSFVVCAFSEVKAFYVLFIIDLFIIVLMQINDKAIRKKVIRILIIAIFAFYIAWQLLSIVMPENLQYFTNLGLYLSYENYGARGGAGRINGFSYVYENVFNSSFVSALIGRGIGSAAGKYAYEYSLLFHEEGLIGVFLLIGFFASAIMDGFSFWRKRSIKSYGIFLVVWSVSIIISLFTWNAVFARPMPIIFLFLGCGYIWKNKPITKVSEK